MFFAFPNRPSMTRLTPLVLFLALGSLSLIGCGPSRPPADVLATTSIIGDAAERIAGGTVRVEVLMGPGTDPHRYQPSAGDLGRLSSSRLVLFNGLHLEGKMTEHLEHAPGGRAVAVTRDLPEDKLLRAEVDGGEHDPHVWFDVARWKTCVGTIRDAMIEKFPEHAATFRANAEAYLKELDDLDREVREKANTLTKEQRVMVTSHDAFRYFADAYKFEVKGLQGVSTGAESGTADVSTLAKYIADHKVTAIFTETSVPERGLQQVLDAVKQQHKWDVKLVGDDEALFSDSLGEPGSPGGTYAGTVRHNIDVIVKHLKK
jgi:manganese/zinc/iron transport system substrate-binding protein